MKLEEHLRCIEGQAHSLVPDMSDPDGLLKTIVAFSNTSGGTLFIGVDPDGSPVGLEFPWHAENMLMNLIRDSVRPLVLPRMGILSLEDRSVLKVTVYPGPLRPYHLVGKGAFVRVGLVNRPADQGVIDSLSLFTAGRGFDEEPMLGLGPDALDLEAAADVFAPLGKALSFDLKALRILVDLGGSVVPTVGGMILFGRDKEEYFPDAWLQCGRFEGRDKSVVLGSVEFREHLPLLPARALEFLGSYYIEGVSARQCSSMPLLALREAVINALVHAEYSRKGSPVRLSVFDDRVEVENPGVLHSGLGMPDILAGVSVLRNRVIGRVFKELGLIDQWGSGVHRMLGECRRLGLPEPSFHEMGNHFRVVFPVLGSGRTGISRTPGRIPEAPPSSEDSDGLPEPHYTVTGV